MFSTNALRVEALRILADLADVPATRLTGSFRCADNSAKWNRLLDVRHSRRRRHISDGDDITVIYTLMRFNFDQEKSNSVKRKHGLSLKEAQEIFDQVYLVDEKSDDPEQFRAIGWCRGRLCSVIFEIKHDSDGEYYHLVTAWQATKEEEQSYAENV